MKGEREVDVLVLGGGAAGLMAAIEAGRRGRSVTVVESQENVGKKILISGGGRCNFTNLHTAPERFLSRNPDFCRSALARYTPEDFLALVQRHGIPYFEKKEGQLFCVGSSRSIVSLLLDECRSAGVEVRCGVRVRDVRKADRFVVLTEEEEWRAPKMIVATGGLSVPKMGASDFAFRLARRFGLGIVEPQPGLVPLVLSGGGWKKFLALAGVSVPCAVRCGGAFFRDNLLFTHRGLSGPAILQISSYWTKGDAIVIDLLPDHDAATLLLRAKRDHPDRHVQTILSTWLPSRFAGTWLAAVGIEDGAAGAISDVNLRQLAERLRAWRVLPSGTEGFRTAEVTRGGIDAAELSSTTMEAKRVPGLYFVGEAVDVTGWLGGYNFQWAWASGAAAGRAA